MTFWKVLLREQFGGQGSGNFGHAGRPGEVGGSADESGKPSEQDNIPRQLGGRAPRGGAIGDLNDERYKGGQFVGATALPKMSPAEIQRKKYSESKQEIAPYQWEKPPSPDHISIYQRIHVFTKFDRATRKLELAVSDSVLKANGQDKEQIQEKIKQYNSGNHWELLNREENK